MIKDLFQTIVIFGLFFIGFYIIPITYVKYFY